MKRTVRAGTMLVLSVAVAVLHLPAAPAMADDTAQPSAKIFLLIMNPVLGDAVRGRPRLNDYYQVYRDLAAEGVAGLIDPAAAWSTVTDRGIPDGVHPTKATQLAITVPAIVRAVAPDCR